MTKILSKRKRKEAERLAKGKNTHRCGSCNKMQVAERMIYGPNPYTAELWPDSPEAKRKVWLCKECYKDICDDI